MWGHLTAFQPESKVWSGKLVAADSNEDACRVALTAWKLRCLREALEAIACCKGLAPSIRLCMLSTQLPPCDNGRMISAQAESCWNGQLIDDCCGS